MPWHAVLATVRQLETSSRTDPLGRPWVKAASEATGYTVHQLRQMDRVMAAVEGWAEDDPNLKVSSIIRLPFSHLEIISRIAVLDRATAKMLVGRDQVDSGFTYRALRDKYYQIRDQGGARPSPKSVGQQNIRIFSQLCYKLLSNQSNLLLLKSHWSNTEKLKLLRWQGGFIYASPDFVVLDQETQERSLYAFNCVTISADPDQAATVGTLFRAFSESMFFEQYFLCCPSYSPAWVFESHRDALGLFNVGLITIGDGKIEKVVEPRGGPCPDRRDILRKDAYVWKRLTRK